MTEKVVKSTKTSGVESGASMGEAAKLLMQNKFGGHLVNKKKAEDKANKVSKGGIETGMSRQGAANNLMGMFAARNKAPPKATKAPSKGIETIENKISKRTDVEKVLSKLKSEYSDRGINLVCISKKWSFRTSPNLSNLMKQEKTVEKKLSRAAIETLSIIVYHQPVTRAEIEEIRGVAFGTNTLEILMELNWVKPGGRKDVPGKPIQYVTTDDFLSHFNLQKLSDLPTVDELGAAGLIDSTNIDNAIFGTGKFYKEKQDDKKEDIYSNIDEMLSSTLNSEDNK